MSRLRLLTGPLRGVRAPAAVLLLAAAVVLTGVAVHAALQYRDAIEVAAVLSAKEVQQSKDDDKARPRYLARYQVTSGGETVEAEESLPRETWEARTPGSAYPVLFHAGNRKILPQPWSEAFVADVLLAGAFGLVLGAIGAPLGYGLARDLYRRIRLSRRGATGKATVTDVFRTSSAVNGVQLWQVRYRYRDARGAEHEGTSDLLFPAEASKWEPGASAAIVFDPDRPAASAWLGEQSAPGDMQRELASEARSHWRSLLQWARALAIFFVALIVAAVLAELVPGLKALDAWIEERHSALLIATMGATVIGVLLMVGSVLVRLLTQGEPLDHTGVEQQQRAMLDARAAPSTWRASTYRIIGKTTGGQVHDEFKMAEFKRAIATGAIFRDPLWRWRASMAFSALVLSLGIFGVLMVVMPLELKLLVCAAFAYAAGQIAWAALRA